jgi:hypothetical protein
MCDSASSVSITNDSMAMTLTTYRCRYQPARSTVVTFVGPLDVTLNGSRCADDFLGALPTWQTNAQNSGSGSSVLQYLTPRPVALSSFGQ